MHYRNEEIATGHSASSGPVCCHFAPHCLNSVTSTRLVTAVPHPTTKPGPPLMVRSSFGVPSKSILCGRHSPHQRPRTPIPCSLAGRSFMTTRSRDLELTTPSIEREDRVLIVRVCDPSYNYMTTRMHKDL